MAAVSRWPFARSCMCRGCRLNDGRSFTLQGPPVRSQRRPPLDQRLKLLSSTASSSVWQLVWQIASGNPRLAWRVILLHIVKERSRRLERR